MRTLNKSDMKKKKNRRVYIIEQIKSIFEAKSDDRIGEWTLEKTEQNQKKM